MLSFTNTIFIEKPLTEVFAFVSDPCNNPKWNYYVVRVEHMNEEEGEGAIYLQTRKKDQQKFKTVEFTQNERCTFEALPGERPAVRRSLVFHESDQQTIISDQFELMLPLPSFFSSVLTRSFKNAVLENLQKLKTLLETESVVLQDGREIHI